MRNNHRLQWYTEYIKCGAVIVIFGLNGGMYCMDEKAALEIIIKICGLVLMFSGLLMLFSSNSIMLIMGIVLAGVGWYLLKIFKPGE